MGRTVEINTAVEKVLDAKEELTKRGVPSGDVVIMVGCALGVLLSGDR